MQTARVFVRFAVQFALTLPDGTTETNRFHTLGLNTDAQDDVRTFLLILEAFLSGPDSRNRPATSLSNYFRSMVRLFSTRPADDLSIARQGLWGELFMMRSYRGYGFWAPYWHSDTTRVFDFSSIGRRLEVKTTISQQREHRFSHRQLFTMGNEEVAIVSLLMTPDDAGLSLRQLINECKDALQNSPEIVKLEQSARRAGMDVKEEHGPSFNPESALRLIGWYWAEHVPHFRMEEPAGVSETHYKADLTGAAEIDSERREAWLSVWRLE